MMMVVVGEAVKQIMVIGIDESEESTYALEWTLDHFFSSPPHHRHFSYKLIIVYAKPLPASVIVTSPVVAVAGAGAADLLPIVDTNLKKNASRIVERAQEICRSKSVADVDAEVVEGDARNVLCEAVERHHASILVVGRHGYGSFKRAILGSVSDYCAHHAHSTVMIVKRPPKTKISK